MKRKFILLPLLIVLLASCSRRFHSTRSNTIPNFTGGNYYNSFQQASLFTVENIEETDEESEREKGSNEASAILAYGNKNMVEWGTESYSFQKLQSKAAIIKEYAEKNGYNASVVFLVDMEIKSGKNRFFIYDLQNNKILKSGLVAHGSGRKGFSYNRTFSNAPGSGCTSLGMYKIGAAYQGSYGLAYKLFGLEESNNNAYKRHVVLHSMGCIADAELNGPLCRSEGCPAVSPLFLKYLQGAINKSEKPMLMWIFN
jgi:hypothetical protein